LSWSGAGIPVIGGTILSGAQTIVFKGSRYLVEHPVVGLEGGIVENLGKPQTRVEIHGFVYESGADALLATLSGFIASGFQEFHIPSFNSGYYFIPSGTGIMFESLKFIYDAGHGYPFYHYVIAGVLSGEVGITNLAVSSAGITYVVPNEWFAQLYNATYAVPDQWFAQVYVDYAKPNQAYVQDYVSYVLISGVSGY
jgi:hypothetical protein